MSEVTPPRPRVVVMHESYGCQTGCCGHVIYLDGKVLSREYQFNHPAEDEDFRQYAEGLVRRAGCDPADLDWEESTVYAWE